MIGGKIGGLVQGFLDRNGRKREEIKGWILHPGGARLLETSRRSWPVQVRHPAILGHSRKRRKSVQRDDSFHSPGVAGKKDRLRLVSICASGGVWPGLQRGISATAMDLSVYLFLALLLPLDCYVWSSLRISIAAPERNGGAGAAKVN